MPLKINGLTTGSVTLAAPATGSDVTLILPSSAGTVQTVPGAWTAYTPTTFNLTVGNGTLTGHYVQIGKLVVTRIYFVMGSTSSISGTVGFSYPVPALSLGNTHLIGTAYFEDNGVLGYNGFVRFAGDRALPSPINSASGGAAFMVSNYPFTWGTGDWVGMTFQYEAA